MKRLPYSIYPRKAKGKTIFYVRFYSEAEGRYVKTVSTGKTTKRDARKVADDLLARGVIGSDDDPVLGTYVEKFWRPDSAYSKLRSHQGSPLSARYIQLNADAYRLHIKDFEPFQRVKVAELTPGLMNRWVSWLADRKAGPRTINIAMQAIMVPVRHWAASERKPDPLAKYKKLKENSRARGVLSVPELFALRDVREGIDPRARVAVLLAGFCGLRLGETRGLRYKDIDLEAGKLWVRQAVAQHTNSPASPKSGSVSETPIPVPDFVVDAIKELRDSSPHGDKGLVILTPDDPNQPINSDIIKLQFRKMLVAIGINDATRRSRRISFHSLRHVAVSFWRYLGFEDFIAQAYARHKTARMTEHYSHGDIIDFDEAKRRLTDGIRAATKQDAK